MGDADTRDPTTNGPRSLTTCCDCALSSGRIWTGTLPAGMHELKSPTNTAMIAGRIQADGPADYAVVNAIQKQYLLAPLSAFGKPYTPPAGVIDPQIDMKTPPMDQVNRMSAETFLNRLATLMASNLYVLHFDKGGLPPVNAFRSLTMYDAASFLAANPINRYNIAGWVLLKYNPDGSLDAYIQHDSPGQRKESNWLPAPEGPFSVTLRMYWPKEPVLDGSWKPPAIQKVSGNAKETASH